MKIFWFYFFQFFHQFFINSFYCRPLLCIFQLFSNWAEVIILLCWIYSRRIQKKNCWVMMIWWAQLGQVAQHTLQIFIGSSNQLQGKSVLLLINSCLTGKPYDIYREKCKLMICMQYRTLPGKKCIHCKCFLQVFYLEPCKMHLILIFLFSNYVHAFYRVLSKTQRIPVHFMEKTFAVYL